MTIIYVLLAISVFLSIVSLTAMILLLKKQNNNGLADLNKNNELLTKDIESIVKVENAMLTGAVNSETQAIKNVTDRFDTFMQAVDFKIDKMREDNFKTLSEMTADNLKALTENRTELSKNISEMRAETNKSISDMRKENVVQLEKMRETVDEKLSSTLDQRFNQSFRIVGARLEEINKSFADLQNLQKGVNDLKGIFNNVKTRGTWGEVALENLLSQILISEQYDKQVRLTQKSNEMVDFAIKLPGKGDGTVYLPIDSKCPLDDYQRLVEASENGDKDGVDIARKAVERRIKQEAMSIRDKYIIPPVTTDFAIMYLPIEGLYAEVVKIDGLIENLQNDYRVVICGPTTIAALLNSLQMGFRSIAIEKRSTEIGKLLQAFIKDFNKFSDLLQKTKKKLEEVQNSISNADKRTELIRRKLDKVSGLSSIEDDETLLEGYLPMAGDGEY